MRERRLGFSAWPFSTAGAPAGSPAQECKRYHHDIDTAGTPAGLICTGVQVMSSSIIAPSQKQEANERKKTLL